EEVLDEAGPRHPVSDDPEAGFRAPAPRAPTTAATPAAQTLSPGMAVPGAAAAFVRRLADRASPQWNGTNTVSSRIAGVILSVNVASARRVESITRAPFESPYSLAVAGCISASGSGAACRSSATS